MRCLSVRSRSLFALLCLALCACERVGAYQLRSNDFDKRALIFGDDTTSAGGATGGAGTTANTDTNTNANTNTNTNTNTATATNPGTAQNTQTTGNQNTGTTAQNTGTTPPTSTQPTQTGNTDTNTQTQNTATTAPQQQQPTDSTSIATDANGSLVTTVVVVNPSSDAISSAAAATSSAASKDNDSGLGTGSIIGMSVAGGIAVIGVVAFFIWKFTRKRYTDFDDEPIKWPELNTHANDNLNYALPATRAAGTGAGAGLDSASEVNLARNTSGAAYSAYSQPSQYTQPSAADSTADLYAPGSDPYAVPPLPHLNPNQPYRDDPSLGSAGYYDPYRGPVPQTFNDTASVSGFSGEAIPMSNLANGAGVAAGRRSPGPQLGLEMGRMSPQPAMAGRQSPGPSLAYGGGRATPTPAAAGVASGRHSPGPGPAYAGGY